jgi:hypothetical protein
MRKLQNLLKGSDSLIFILKCQSSAYAANDSYLHINVIIVNVYRHTETSSDYEKVYPFDLCRAVSTVGITEYIVTMLVYFEFTLFSYKVLTQGMRISDNLFLKICFERSNLKNVKRCSRQTRKNISLV